METKFYLITRTIPEWNGKHKRLYTCSIGFSPTLGLIRVYPIPLLNDFNSGYIYDIEIEKRKTDSRARSYELVGGYGNQPMYRKLKRFTYPMIADQLKLNEARSINELNRKKDSIGLLRINDFNVYWDASDRWINNLQIGLFEDVELADFTKYTKESRQKESRVKFKDADGYHDLQFNEWGIYEFGRKFGYTKDAFRHTVGASHILVGNMLQFQNKWMVMKFFKLELQEEKTIINSTQLNLIT